MVYINIFFIHSTQMTYVEVEEEVEQDAHETMEEDSETIEVNNSKEASHSIV